MRALVALRPDVGRTLLAVARRDRRARLRDRADGHLRLADLPGGAAPAGAVPAGRGGRDPGVRHRPRACCATSSGSISHDVALRGVAALRERLYRALAAADPATVAGLRRGDLLARVGADVDTLADLVVRSLLPFAVAVTTVARVRRPGRGAAAAGRARRRRRPRRRRARAPPGWPPWPPAVPSGTPPRPAPSSAPRCSPCSTALGELTVAGRRPDPAGPAGPPGPTRLAGELDRAARPAALAAGLSTLATGLAMVAALALGVQAVRRGSLDDGAAGRGHAHPAGRRRGRVRPARRRHRPGPGPGRRRARAATPRRPARSRSRPRRRAPLPLPLPPGHARPRHPRARSSWRVGA